jgi:imidazolonepropionase-like amidohydrolase
MAAATATILGLALLQAQGEGPTQAFVGARLINVEGVAPTVTDDGVIVVRGGRVVATGPAASVKPPTGAAIVDLGGKYVTPGLINAHGHVSDIDGLRPRAYTDANTARQLALFARYGITTVWSLGGEQAPAFAARDAQDVSTLNRSRLYVAGEIITASTPAAAREAVIRVAATRPDVIKIRVDDNLGSSAKMAPEVYRAIIDEAHKHNLRVAAHLFYLEDAKDLLRAGVDIIAHSVRDKEIDDEFIALMKARNVPYCPTLTRDLSTFVYESRPDFLSDPFFLRDADPDVVARVQEPARQQAMQQSASARAYKAALAVALRNLKRASDAGLLIAMGTDSGASAERFEGYFEHVELAMMADAGLSPARILRSATVDAAATIGVKDIGRLTPGAWADFVVFDASPLTDIRNTKTLSSVWIAGNRVPSR